MAAPNVNIRENDQSTRVPEFPGIYGGLLIPGAKKGQVGVPYLVTSESELLKNYTPDERIDVGFDLSYYSALAFLQKSNKLWVVRVANASLYGGATVTKSTAAAVNAAYSTGEAIPNNHTFVQADDCFVLYGANQGAWNNKIKVKLYNYKAPETVTFTASTFGLNSTQSWTSGFPVILSTTGVLPAALASGNTYYIIKTATPGKFDLALSEADAVANTKIALADVGTGIHNLRPAKEYTKEPNTFLLQVYKTEADLTNSLKEEFVCSLEVGKKDGYGKNIYVESVLESSNYVRAMTEPGVEANSTGIVPKEQFTTFLSLAAGSDGTIVTDSNMLLALDTLRNTQDKPLTVAMDGGWSTPAYQKQGLLSLAEARKDTVAILSTPFEKESSANYLNDIVNYRKIELNANSSFGALYTPHTQIHDKFNDRKIFVAPDGYAGAAISATASNYEMWYPVGGFKRGQLDVLDVRRRFTEGEMDYLYDNGINPIRFAPGRGILIWGQKTLLARPSSLDRLNVRLLLIVVEPAVKASLEDFLFELNTTGERALASAKVADYMEGIKARNGVYDFYIVCDKTNNSDADIDNHIMNLHLFVKPTQSIEYIPFTTVITSTGIDFSLAQQAI